jgi:class 3 adenylate cyclase
MQERRHVTIMFTDIVGYTALMGKDEDLAFEWKQSPVKVLSSHHVSLELSAFDGKIWLY